MCKMFYFEKKRMHFAISTGWCQNSIRKTKFRYFRIDPRIEDALIQLMKVIKWKMFRSRKTITSPLQWGQVSDPIHTISIHRCVLHSSQLNQHPAGLLQNRKVHKFKTMFTNRGWHVRHTLDRNYKMGNSRRIFLWHTHVTPRYGKTDVTTLVLTKCVHK